MPDIIDRISSDLSVPRPMISDAIRLAHVRFKKIRVRKRSGGERIMIQPTAELKLVLTWLDSRVFSLLPVHAISTAFQPGTSIVKNARAHRHSDYSVRVDISNFFPSICSADLLHALAAASNKVESWTLDPDFSQVIKQACFDRNDRLPIGYLTSPRIANAIMYEFDTLLCKSIVGDTARFGQSVLTRYADDFVFSTNKSGACKEFVDEIRSALTRCANPKLKLNEKKTRYMSRKGGSTLITGLRINMDGNVGVHPNYRDHVRLLLKLFSAGTLKIEDNVRLRGHLAFIEHADPRLFTKISFKYYNEIAKLRE